MLLDMNSLGLELTLLFVAFTGVLVAVIVITRAGRRPPSGRTWDEMKGGSATPRTETTHLSPPSGTWPPPSGRVDPAAGNPTTTTANDTGSGYVSNLIPL